MYNLKKINADPNMPHHYMIGVAMHSAKAGPKLRGKLYLKYGPIYFHHKDIENMQNAAMMSVDKVFKTTSKEASEMYDCQHLVSGITGLKLAAQANEATLHHFSSEYKITDDWFKGFVENANSDEISERKLDDARIRGC
jgi:hypothetical protein